MAIMRRDIDGLGLIGIVVEAFKIFSGHAKTFILIQLTLILPLVILLAVVDYFLIASLPPPNVNQPGLLKVFFARHAGPDLPVLLLTWLASYALTIVLLAVAQSLSQSTNLYCVGLHYAGQPVFFIDALRAAIPRLWIRLALTTTYLNFLSTAIPLVMTVGGFLRKGESNRSPWTVAGLLLAAVIFLVWTIFIWQLYSLSAGVQYTSFKAYHGESLSRSLYENRTTEGTYAVLSGDGNNEALVGG